MCKLPVKYHHNTAALSSGSVGTAEQLVGKRVFGDGGSSLSVGPSVRHSGSFFFSCRPGGQTGREEEESLDRLNPTSHQLPGPGSACRSFPLL